jgi:Xaa-Pro aminopeptidase
MPAVEDGLLPGMSLNIEVGYYMQGVQGFLCEDTMLVTENGFERFTTNSKSLDLRTFLDGSTAR